MKLGRMFRKGENAKAVFSPGGASISLGFIFRGYCSEESAVIDRLSRGSIWHPGYMIVLLPGTTRNYRARQKRSRSYCLFLIIIDDQASEDGRKLRRGRCRTNWLHKDCSNFSIYTHKLILVLPSLRGPDVSPQLLKLTLTSQVNSQILN